MPKLKPGTIIPTDAENAAITTAAVSDPDAVPLTDEEWDAVKPMARIGRPRKESPKVFTGIRLDADVLDAFKSTGSGWQTRINDALREWLKEHPAAGI